MVNVSTILESETFVLLDQECKNLGTSKSAFLKKLIENKLTGIDEPKPQTHSYAAPLPIKEPPKEPELTPKEKEEIQHKNYQDEKAAFQEVYREELKSKRREREMLGMMEHLNDEIEALNNKIESLRNENLTLKRDITVLDKNCQKLAGIAGF